MIAKAHKFKVGDEFIYTTAGPSHLVGVRGVIVSFKNADIVISKIFNYPTSTETLTTLKYVRKLSKLEKVLK